jgi:cobalt/nickel transport system permease protein
MELLNIEQEAVKDSPIHRLDGRIKVLSLIFLVLSAVYIGRSSGQPLMSRLISLGALEFYLLAILFAAKLNKYLFLRRMLLILPFGGFIALLKPFVEEGKPLYTFPGGVTVTFEGVAEGALLLSIMIVSISSILLLSSTTPIPRLISSLRRIGFPQELALLFGMTLRYLFLYIETFHKITDAQKTRCFRIRNRRVRTRFILEQLGYTVLMIFIRSYQQGLNIYQSMSSRGYHPNSTLPLGKSKVSGRDISFALITCIMIGFALFGLPKIFSMIYYPNG